MPGQSAITEFTRTIVVPSGVFAPGHLGELTQYLPFELVDEVLDRTRTVQRRLRRLPSRVGVYFILAMCLFPGAGYLRVWDKLVCGIRALGPWMPSEKALREVRRRLGPAPFKELFEVVAGPLAQPSTPGVCYRRWRTVAFDGCSSLQTPDTPGNLGVLGKARRHRGGLEGYPHVRLMALRETGTRGLLGAVFGSTSEGEPDYARRLLSRLNSSMLLLADRGFSGDEFLNEVADTGAQLLVRATLRRRPAVMAILPDGSYLTRLRGRTFRVIEADVTAVYADGTRIGDRYRLITTLLDHRSDPADRLIALYHERWEVEISFLALKDTLFTGRVLRSAGPAGLEQELWALLTLYQVLCRIMVDAVESRPGTAPDRASFTVALHAAAEQVITAHGILDPVDHVGDIGRSVLAALHPTRRPRTSARKVKCPMSQYNGSPSENRPTASQRITTIGIAVLPLPANPDEPASRNRAPGFRELTLRVLRTDPGRAWRTVEISRALGITVTSKYRSLCTQTNRWAEEAMLIRESRGKYRLAPEWLAPSALQRST
ncbi:IS4 family transposase [Streptomyces sp. NPDC046984]|uniref:IS4 family transposase n=1 Tax=Streptomyces sp. NPDC046984 TaxID=3155138 RepID=UPI0033D291AE